MPAAGRPDADRQLIREWDVGDDEKDTQGVVRVQHVVLHGPAAGKFRRRCFSGVLPR